ncbi:MAG TPA: saccharopine dehydrogenase C-terminal domain-containing protein [Vicinamibacterales bacterium]|jgi:saccharopine dehydrogenase-like NADP-dependent oxidoreductase
MKKIVVLGAGLVGKEIAKDLSGHYHVTAVDRSREALAAAFKGFAVETLQADCTDMNAVKKTIEPFDLVVGALPGWLGKRAFQAVIEAKKDVVDIAFFPEDPFDLDELAKKNDVTAIMDFGVAPGMSNIFAGHHQKHMQKLHRLEILVGGLPTVREFPFEYKAVFSPADVIEEYTRPARYIEGGREIVRPALTDPELLHFDGIGTLESFNTDGLRSLATTITCENMKEKTLRYPGHIRLMQALRDTGFFDKTPIEIGGAMISPLEFTSRIMFPVWKLRPEEEEFTVMRVEIEGDNRDGRREKVTYNLLDRFDTTNKVTSMARTTGYTATAAVRLLADGLYSRKGVLPPEFVAEDDRAFAFVLAHLKERNIHFHKTVEQM